MLMIQYLTALCQHPAIIEGWITHRQSAGLLTLSLIRLEDSVQQTGETPLEIVFAQ
jgi:hypothetical protein